MAKRTSTRGGKPVKPSRKTATGTRAKKKPASRPSRKKINEITVADY